MYAILLIAPPAIAPTVADELQRALNTTVEIAGTHRAALGSLRRRSYSLILMDELLVADVAVIDQLYENAGGAMILELNFAICSGSRMVRQARAALSRRAHDQNLARTAAANALQSELNETLAGLLLQSQLALREASPALKPKLQNLVQLAGDLRERLRA